MKINDIFNFLNRLYPFASACDFDNSGLLIGDKNAYITNVVIALDCTRDVVDFAVKNNANLIITHHPIIFGGLKSVCADTAVFDAVNNNISVISAHTNLDTADGGLNDTLAQILGLTEISKIVCDDGFTFRKGILQNAVTADELAEKASAVLKFNVRYVDGGKKIKTVAVCSGAGSDMLKDAICSGADAFLSSEIKHNVFIDAFESGITCLDLGHFATEQIIVPKLESVLSEEFPDIAFIPYTKQIIKYI